jgi:iron complex outermembrane receptor protein
VNDDVLLYGTISNGFKSGGFNGANSNTTLQLLPIKPEVLTSYEAGVKATLLDGAMQLNASTFFYDYRDKQETDAHVAFVGNISGLTNVPKSEVTGTEFDMRWLPGGGWDLRLNVALLNSEIKEWMAVDTVLSAWPEVVRKDASGGPLAMSPDLQYTAVVTKQWEMDGDSSLDITLVHTYSDATPNGDPFIVGGEEYSYTDMRLGYGPADGAWRLLFWGRNITDEAYFPNAILGGNGPFVRSYGMPRTFGVSVDVKIGN